MRVGLLFALAVMQAAAAFALKFTGGTTAVPPDARSLAFLHPEYREPNFPNATLSSRTLLIWNSTDALARALAVHRWFESSTRPAGVDAPSWWHATGNAALVLKKGTRAGGGIMKKVSLNTIRVGGTNVSVVVKSVRNEESVASLRTLKMEMLFLEYLRGEPGIPQLHGAFFDTAGKLHAVVQRCGVQLGTFEKQRPRKRRYKKEILGRGYLRMARANPIGVARAWVLLFRSFAERGGFLLHDFTPRQFMYTYEYGVPSIYLVDGPSLHWSPIAEATGVMAPAPNQCSVSAECTGLKSYHCCCPNSDDKITTSPTKGAVCPPGSTGAPESHGICGSHGAAPGSCAPFTHKGHLYDLGGKRWILPGLLKWARASDARRIQDAMEQCT